MKNKSTKETNIETIEWMILQLGGKINNTQNTDVDFLVFDSKLISKASAVYDMEGKGKLVNKQFVIGKFIL